MDRLRAATKQEIVAPGRVALQDGYIRLFADGSLWDEETGATYARAEDLPEGVVEWDSSF